MINNKSAEVMMLFLISIFFSCESTDTVTSGLSGNGIMIKTNLPPTSISLTSSADTISFWENINLTCVVEDPENDPLTYEWTSYRVTDNSSLENYEIIELVYWLNQGVFTASGSEAVWIPGKLEGKYLILCYVQDKAGYEVSDKIIVQVVSAGSVTALTDKFTYRLGDFDTSAPYPGYYYLNLDFKVQNHVELKTNFYGCGLVITPGVEKMKDNQWSVYFGPNGCDRLPSGFEDVEHRDFVQVEVFSQQVFIDSVWSQVYWNTFDPGHYRLFYPYSLGPFYGYFTDTLYSNEFELVE